jgi:hypothetical protein
LQSSTDRNSATPPIKRQSLSILQQYGVPVRTVLDVGVLHGTPELIEVFPDIRHILFEPVAEFANHIAKAYAGTPHTLVSAAVSDRSGETALETTSIIPGLEISHMIVAILRHTHDLLVPCGILANTHDIVFGDPIRPVLLRDCEKKAGIEAILNDREALILSAPFNYVA